VPAEHAIHGIHGIGVHVATRKTWSSSPRAPLFGKDLLEQGDRVVLQVGRPTGAALSSWWSTRADEPGPGVTARAPIHHFAWNAETLETRTS